MSYGDLVPMSYGDWSSPCPMVYVPMSYGDWSSPCAMLKHQDERSILNAKLLNEVITNYTKTTVLEQIKLKDKINSLLGYLKDALLNSATKLHAYLMQAHDFYQNFEKMLSLWKQHSTNLVYDFGNFMEEVIHNCNSLRKKLCLEFMPLNSEQDKIIDIVMDCKNEMESMISCCTKDIQMSVETSMKLLFEILNLLGIVQVKMKEQKLIIFCCLSGGIQPFSCYFVKKDWKMSHQHDLLELMAYCIIRRLESGQIQRIVMARSVIEDCRIDSKKHGMSYVGQEKIIHRLPQDNVRPYTALLVESLIAAETVWCMEWPACSLDPYLIKHL
ncbi:uncharacterized protein TNCV_569561 [Trichonephila clavipes]|nr:uncharacterized protein TNCV_569561 [Trichonephila clavipes]